VVELSVALVLLVGAGLLIRTFWNLRSVESGFNPDHLMTMRIQLPETRYKEVARQTRFRTQVLAGINSLPGVQAAMISELPLSGEALDHEFLIENRPPIAPGDEPSLQARSVLGDYFKVMQIPLLAGRDFGPQDLTENAPLVGIANKEMVRQYFPNEDPVGKRIRWASDSGIRWVTIVGVVGDVKHFGLDLPELPALYSPYTQINPWKRWMSLAARTEGDPKAMTQSIKQEIWKVDTQLPLTRVETMDEMAAESFAARRFNMSLLTLFAGLALVLAAIGIYGVMSYAVTQRTQEIGIRMALGARSADVLGLVLRKGMFLVLIGITLGLVGAFALTRLMVTLLFGVTPTDAFTIGFVSVIFIMVAFIACFIPARRATKVDPLVALRYE
jgi:putative ABC transport system permease protein